MRRRLLAVPFGIGLPVRVAVLLGLALPTACQPAPAAPRSSAATPDSLAIPRFDPPTGDAGGPAPRDPVEPGDGLALVSGRQRSDAAAVVSAALPIAAEALGAGPDDHLHLEGIDWPGPAAAVVTVLSLEVTPSGVLLRRVAVPISLVDGVPAGAGPALLLPVVGPDRPAMSLATSPIDDEATWQAAHEALTSAGFTNVRVLRLDSAIEAWPVVATFRAGGGQERGADLVAWLRRDGARLVLAGLPPDPAGAHAPDGDTTTDRTSTSEDPS